jgi:carbamoyltransferase
MLGMVREAHALSGSANVVLAGGVALNCVANGRIAREGPFKRVWIQPAAGDAGGALGAALFIWYQLLEKARHPQTSDSQKGSLLGPSASEREIGELLRREAITAERFDDEQALVDHVAELLAEGKTAGWFQGRMEFGPRALGARSILGDPRSRSMQSRMNLQVKFRESFRPFAPAVLLEHADEWFEIGEQESPYMLLVAKVREKYRRSIPDDERTLMETDPDLRRRVNIVRSSIPAVTHVDFSARLQTVDRERNPRFHRLLSAFCRRTGCPILVNTSFNVRGEPIVRTPMEAYRCFRATEIDILVLENYVIRKIERDSAGIEERHQYVSRFELD